jgi:hypothetical protein
MIGKRNKLITRIEGAFCNISLSPKIDLDTPPNYINVNISMNAKVIVI